MGIISKCAVAAAVAAVGVGASASAASAITITGGPAFTGTWNTSPSMTLGGAYTMNCDGGFSGTVIGSTTMAIQPEYECSVSGLAATFEAPGGLELEVTSSTPSAGIFGYKVTVPSGTAITVSVPLAGCTLTVAGPQTLGSGLVASVGRMWNVLSAGVPAIELDAAVGNISYTASGCPVSAGNDGTFDSNGSATLPGLQIVP